MDCKEFIIFIKIFLEDTIKFVWGLDTNKLCHLDKVEPIISTLDIMMKFLACGFTTISILLRSKNVLFIYIYKGK